MQHIDNTLNTLATSIGSLSMFNVESWPQKLIKAGCAPSLLNELHEVNTTNQLGIDYKALYLHFTKIHNEKRESGHVVLREFVNEPWKLLCLTGQTVCISHVMHLIQADTTIPNSYPAEVTVEKWRDTNYIEALSYTVYTGNTQEIVRFYEKIQDKTIFSSNPALIKLLLINAIYSNNLDAVKWTANTLDIAPSVFKSMQKNILHFAAELGNLDMMEYAVTTCEIDKNNVHPESQINALQIAVLFGKLDAVKYAHTKLGLDYKAMSKGKTLLHFAFEGGHLETIKYLVETLKMNVRRLSEEGDTILHFAAMGGNPEAMRYAVTLGIKANCRNKNGATALHYAASIGSVASVQCAVELGCDINSALKNDIKAIHFGADSGDLATLQYIVSLMKPHAVKVLLNIDPNIIKSIIQSNMGVPGIKFAVSSGLDLSIKTDEHNSNLLINAATQYNTNNISVFNYLVAAGIKPETNAVNITILHMAALSGDPEMVSLAYQTLIAHNPSNNPLKPKIDPVIMHYVLQSCNPDAVVSMLNKLHVEALNQEPSTEPLKIAFI